MQTRNTNDAWLLPAFRRLAAVTVLAWAMMATYLFINRLHFGAITTVEMPSWVPFWPGFFPPYVGLMLLTWFLPVALQNPDRFRACLRAYVWAWLLVIPWWLFTPTMLLRPPLPGGFWAHAFTWLWNVDEPLNVTPCAHAVGPIVAAWFAAREYPAWRWPLIVTLLLTLPSIALVWQHRPVDILLGAVAAGIGIAIAEAVGTRKRARIVRVPDDEGSSENPSTPSTIDA